MVIQGKKHNLTTHPERHLKSMFSVINFKKMDLTQLLPKLQLNTFANM